MRFILPILLFLSSANWVLADQNLEIFDYKILLQTECSLEIASPDGSKKPFSLPFENKEDCAIILKSETNIPHVEFINDSYVFLVEARSTKEGVCKASYVAVVLPRNGKVTITQKPLRTGTCKNDQDRAAFEYLYSNIIKQ
jgi:hypothetical protein